MENSTPRLITFLRHARSIYNEQKRWQGQFDSPLSASGREQLLTSLNRLPRYDKVISSDLVRAAETAELIACDQGLSVSFDPRLREREIGPWTGLTSEQIIKKWPKQSVMNVHPQSEQLSVFRARILMCCDELLNQHQPNTHILIVTHRGVIEQIVRHYSPHYQATHPSDISQDYDGLQLSIYCNSLQLSYHSYGIRRLSTL